MNPVTVFGENLLRKELERLLGSERPRIVKAIATAREHGDLRENGEYKAAREQQGLVEARISTLERRLGNLRVIDIKSIPPSGKIIFGVTVTLYNLDEKKRITYQIVGEDEADIAQGKISYASPFARVLIGKSQGDEIEIQASEKRTRYSVEKVEHI